MKNCTLALLIDADNISSDALSQVMLAIEDMGQLVVRRIYGDWSMPHLSGWKNHIHRYAIEPIQQFAYSKGKNATDMALTIDAMDLLNQEKVDGFCILSSDCDFTPLALRIKKSGLLCYGFGLAKTPEPFQQACDEFYEITIFKDIQTVTQPQPQPQPQPKIVKLLKQSIKNAVLLNPKLNGWADYSMIANEARKIDTQFNHKDYGCSTFGKLIEKHQSYFKFKKEGSVNYATIQY